MSVAILLSTFNGERFLGEQLASIERQTHRDWTLYWRDDGSADGTAGIVRAFLASGRGQCLDGRGRFGATESFLCLLRHAAAREHEAVGFADQDDVWLPEKLARAVAALADVPTDVPALYLSRQVLVDAVLRRRGLSPPIRRQPGFPGALIQNVATGCTVVLNRAGARLVAASVPPVAAFHDWWCYLVIAAAGGRVVADDAATVLYRQHAENVVGAPESAVRRGLGAVRRGSGPFMALLRQHVAALRAQEELLSLSSREQLAALAAGLGGGLAARLAVLRMPGLRRQTALETLMFRLWFLAG